MVAKLTRKDQPRYCPNGETEIVRADNVEPGQQIRIFPAGQRLTSLGSLTVRKAARPFRATVVEHRESTTRQRKGGPVKDVTCVIVEIDERDVESGLLGQRKPGRRNSHQHSLGAGTAVEIRGR